MKILLFGAPNSGKSTLFNLLTGASAHVGNFSGVTVDILAGELIFDNKKAQILDLPGTYSMSSRSEEERVAIDALTELSPDRVIFICDATCLSRSLYLLMPLMEKKLPLTLALNMSDELTERGGSIDTKKLSDLLGIRAHAICARTGEGVESLLESVFSQPPAYIPPAFSDINSRYEFIDRVLLAAGYLPPKDIQKAFSPDKAFLNKYLAIPVFLALCVTAFFVAFGPIGQTMVDILSLFTEFLALKASQMPGLMWDYISSCLIRAVGGVLAFLPPVMLLSLFTSFMEDSGYMARAAIIMDKPLKNIGLSGRAFIPLMMGFGCTVPAAMAVRAIASKDERAKTLFILPFISCGARVPIYMLFARMFYPKFSAFSLLLIYIFCISIAFWVGFAINKSIFKGRDSGFIMELPPYRLPTAKSVIRLVVNTLKSFLARIFGVILIANTVLWALSSFTPSLSYTSDQSTSILASIAGSIAPIFSPLGFGHWQAVAALISGLAAKENVVASIGLLYGSAENFSQMFSLPSALSFVTFSALYTPCIPAQSALLGEMKSLKTFILSMTVQFFTAYFIAFIINLIL